MDPIRISLGIDTAAAAESIRDFMRETERTLNGGIVTSVERAQRAFDELGRKIRTIGDVIEQNRQKALNASQAEQEAIKKLNQARQLEILKLQEKRTKLSEVIALSTTGSERESAAIKNATDDRVEEINAMKDQIRAQMGINKEVESGSSLLQSYFGQFLGIGAVIGSLKMIGGTLQAQREEIERTIGAIEHFRGLNKDQFSTYKPFFSEFGITGQSKINTATAALENIRNNNPGITQAQLSETAAGLAATLRESGVTDVQSEQFQGLVGNAARYVDKGVNATQISNFLFEQLKANPKLTGGELNKQLGDVVGVAGSPGRASQLLETFYTNREKAQQAGLGFQDVEKMFTFLRKGGEAPDQIPQDISRALQGLDRLLGLNPEERMELKEKMALSGAGGLHIPTSKSEVPAFANALSKMDDKTRAMVSHAFAGPRGVVAAQAIAGFQNVQLPTGSSLEAPGNNVQSAEAAAQAAQAAAAAAHPTSPGQAYFDESVKQETQDLTNNPSKLPWYRRGSFAGKYLGWTAGAFTPDTSEIARGRVRTRELLRAARLREDISTGKVKATPQETAQLDTMLKDMFENTAEHTNPAGESPLWALAHGKSAFDGRTRSQVLGGIKDDEEFINSLPADVYSTGLTDLQKTGEGYDKFNTLSQKLTGAPATPPKPTTQPIGPQSINYHIRQVNYGYGFDQIGAPDSNPNRYG